MVDLEAIREYVQPHDFRSVENGLTKDPESGEDGIEDIADID